MRRTPRASPARAIPCLRSPGNDCRGMAAVPVRSRERWHAATQTQGAGTPNRDETAYARGDGPSGDAPARPDAGQGHRLAARRRAAADYWFEPKWDGFRCIVFRDGDEVVLGSRNERPLTRYFPELLDPLRAVAAGALRGRRRDRRRRAGRARLRRAAAAHPPRRVARADGWPARPRRRSWRSTCWRSTTASLMDERSSSGGALLETALAERRAADPPHARHRPTAPSPRTGSCASRAPGLDGVHGQARRRHLPTGQAGPAQGEAPAHRRLRGRRLPRAQERRRRRLAAARPLRRRGPAAQPRGGVVVLGGPPRRAARRAGALRHRRPQRRIPWGEWTDAAAHDAGERRAPARRGRRAGTPRRTCRSRRCDPSWSAEVAYERVDNGRFRHSARFLRWRPDRDAGRRAPSSSSRSSRRSSSPRCSVLS